MQVNITVRHVEIDNNLKPYMNEKLEKLKKYNNAIEEARAILDKEKFNFTSEITSHIVPNTSFYLQPL